jgi:hypothetical protein
MDVKQKNIPIKNGTAKKFEQIEMKLFLMLFEMKY